MQLGKLDICQGGNIYATVTGKCYTSEFVFFVENELLTVYQHIPGKRSVNVLPLLLFLYIQERLEKTATLDCPGFPFNSP